jgi:lipopolysaccharide export system permease protein
LIVAVLTFYIAPNSFQHSEQVLNKEKNRSELDLMKAGQFLPLRNSGGVIYSGSFVNDHRLMQDVFITHQAQNGNWIIMRSVTGHQQYTETTDERYLVLEDGYRYQLIPGNFVADRLQFSSLKQHLEPAAVQKARRFQYETLPTLTLLDDSDPKARAVLQWRISLLILVPVVALIAVAMSRTTPRRGRYVKLLPAMLLYFAYMSSLDVLRNRVAEGELSVMTSYIITHVPFVLIGVVFLWWEHIVLWRRSR